MSDKKKKVEELLCSIKGQIGKVIPFDLKNKDILTIELSDSNKDLKKIDISDTKQFTEYIFSGIKKNKAVIGISGYAENRTIYKTSALFNSRKEPRSIHIGIDIWMEEGTKVYCPLQGILHSSNYNTGFGDFGPTIIIEHNIDGICFYTMYANLSLGSLKDIKPGYKYSKGDVIGEVGGSAENGQWPPHLHFQVITDMLGKKGDFYGVITDSEKKYILQYCVDPNLILNLDI